MARRLQLVKSALTEVPYQWVTAFRLRLDAFSIPEAPADPHVFLYRRDTANPYDGSVNDTFFSICGPVEMADYPVGEPSSETPYTFFRLNYIEVDVYSRTIANRLYNEVVEEVDNLLKALDLLDTIVPLSTVEVGNPLPATPTSDSSSSSMSAEP